MTKNMHVHILLDRSGSMESCRSSTVDAVNEYLTKLATTDTDTVKTVSLTTFDDISIDDVWSQAAPDAVKLSMDSYVPRGMTPLLDAIGKAVAKLDALGLPAGHLIALVIVTDGLENASREFGGAAGRESIKKMLTDRQDNRNWLVIYLGANQDAIEVGATFGTSAANTMSFNTRNIGQTMSAAVRSTSAYGVSGQNTMAAFSDEERKEAMAWEDNSEAENGKKDPQ